MTFDGFGIERTRGCMKGEQHELFDSWRKVWSCIDGVPESIYRLVGLLATSAGTLCGADVFKQTLERCEPPRRVDLGGHLPNLLTRI
jgi:hypothetical protein